jgi:hypothetical protein
MMAMNISWLNVGAAEIHSKQMERPNLNRPKYLMVNYFVVTAYSGKLVFPRKDQDFNRPILDVSKATQEPKMLLQF